MAVEDTDVVARLDIIDAVGSVFTGPSVGKQHRVSHVREAVRPSFPRIR